MNALPPSGWRPSRSLPLRDYLNASFQTRVGIEIAKRFGQFSVVVSHCLMMLPVVREPVEVLSIARAIGAAIGSQWLRLSAHSSPVIVS